MKLVDLSKNELFSLNKVFNSYEELIDYFKQFNENFYKENNFYYEKHHIVPKCEGGEDSEKNIVYIDLIHHAIAHNIRANEYFLTGQKDLAYKNVCSAMRILGCYHKYSEIISDSILKEACKIKQNFLKMIEDTGRFKDSIYVTNGTSTKRILKIKLDSFLEENKDFYIGRTFRSPSNKIWITNDIERKYLEKEEAELFLSENKNWHRGMSETKKHNIKNKSLLSSTKNKKWIHKDNIRKNVFPEEIESYLKDGWILGSGNSNTNAGKVCIHRDNIMKNVSKLDLQSWLDSGWKIGRTEEYKSHCRVKHKTYRRKC